MKNLLDFKHIKFSFHYGMRLRPMRDWFVLLSVIAVLLIASAVWNLWYYEAIRAASGMAAAPPSAAPVFSQSSVSQIQSIFSDRATEESKYLDHGYSFIDPSK